MGDLTGFLERLFELSKYEDIRKGLFVVLPIAVLLGFWVGRFFPNYRRPHAPDPGPIPNARISELEELIESLQAQLAIGSESVKRAREAVALAGPGLWLSAPPSFPLNYHVIKSSIPIFTVANLKGGVGKTTIAANLAAHFVNPFRVADRKCERVLLIDLDFQGSLSSMTLTIAERMPHVSGQSAAALLLSGKCTGADLVQKHQRVKGLDALPNSSNIQFYALPTYYDLAQAENRLMVEWLLSDGSCDMRYNLSEVLFSDDVQHRYDRIIIDAPPRLTTATVQALAASTHVLIPTVLDQLSGEAVGSFVDQAIVHSRLWPHLKIIGVLGSMTEQDQQLNLKDYEKEGIIAINEALKQVQDNYGLRGPATEMLPRGSFTPELTELGRAAGTRIGYLSPSMSEIAIKTRRVFDSLGAAVIKRLPDSRELKDIVR